MVLKYTIFLISFFTLNIYGQVTDRFPVRFGQYYQDKTMINPAAANQNNGLDANVGYLSFFGSFSEVRTFYGSVHKKLGREVSKAKSSLGLFLYGDREGEVLNRSRVYLNYAVHIPLKNELILATGAYLGFVSFSTKPTTSTAGASDLAPDGALGVWLYDKDFYAGLSVNQVFNLTLRPLEEEFLLQRHLNFLGGYEVKGVQHRFLTHLNVRLTKDWVFDIGEIVKFYNKYLVGVNYRHLEGMHFALGAQQLNLGQGNLGMQFSYQVPFRKNERANIATYEITINYLVD